MNQLIILRGGGFPDGLKAFFKAIDRLQAEYAAELGDKELVSCFSLYPPKNSSTVFFSILDDELPNHIQNKLLDCFKKAFPKDSLSY